MTEVLPRDVTFDDQGLRFEMESGYWGTLMPEKAQALALEILARWPLERCERATVGDWKADASRYLKDSNMLTRRFARRVYLLSGMVEDAAMQLSVQVLATEALTGAQAAEVMKESPPPKFETAMEWGNRCLPCHGRGYPCSLCKGEADAEGRCAHCHGQKMVRKGETTDGGPDREVKGG